MLEGIKKFFGASMSRPADPDADRAGKDIRLAACALLLELAHADADFSEEERRHLEAAVRRQFSVDEPEAHELLELAEAERRQAVDLWQFTSLIADSYSAGQKMVLVEVMWGLVYADGKVDKDEDYLMRKIFNLLRLEPGYLAEARKRIEQDTEGGID